MSKNIDKEPKDGTTPATESEHAEQSQEAPPAEVSQEELAELQQALEAANKKAAENLEGWQRERAEFANYRKRIEREQVQTLGSIKGEVVKRYLTILDDLERAMKNRPAEGEGAKWAEGIELIYRKLQGILEAEGVNRIPAEEQEFDPNVHEAISHEPSEAHQSGEIIEVVQQGYTIGDRVIRPALVRVSQ
jgi:molecular chaperone GrpE